MDVVEIGSAKLASGWVEIIFVYIFVFVLGRGVRKGGWCIHSRLFGIARGVRLGFLMGYTRPRPIPSVALLRSVYCRHLARTRQLPLSA